MALVPGTSYLWRSKITIFRRYLCLSRLKNLFKNRIFVISVQNCILQLNFKAQLLLIKIQLITAKSQIQATWRHLLPGNLFKSETFSNYFRDSVCASLKTNYAVMFPATWCIYWHHRFSKSCNFIFGTKNR